MVFSSSEFEISRRAQHWHGGDDWADMEEVPQSHDPAAADPERGWKHGRVFRCTTCNEQFRVMDPADAPAAQ